MNRVNAASVAPGVSPVVTADSAVAVVAVDVVAVRAGDAPNMGFVVVLMQYLAVAANF
jgi:hypothetical protein